MNKDKELAVTLLVVILVFVPACAALLGMRVLVADLFLGLVLVVVCARIIVKNGRE